MKCVRIQQAPIWLEDVLSAFTGQFGSVYVDDIIVYSKAEDQHATEKANSSNRLWYSWAECLTSTRKVPKTLPRPHDLHALSVFLGLLDLSSLYTPLRHHDEALTSVTQKGVCLNWTLRTSISRTCQNHIFRFNFHALGLHEVFRTPQRRITLWNYRFNNWHNYESARKLR